MTVENDPVAPAPRPSSPAASPLLAQPIPIPFDAILAEDVEPAMNELLADARARLAAIGAQTGTPTYATTLDALEGVTERVERAMAIVDHLEGVATSPALRAAVEAVQPAVSELFSSIALDAGAYGALKAFAATDEAKALDPVRARFLTKTLAEFRRNGAELDAAGKKKLAALDVELAQLTLRFSQNVLDATNAFELVVEDEARLAGLPPSAIAAARASAEAKGVAGFRFTLQAPSYVPAITYLDDASIRRQLYLAFNERATSERFDNRPLLEKILLLRRAKATILGYASFADLVLEERMAKHGARAREFVRTLRARTEPFFAKEREDLAAFRREVEGASAPALEAWDVAYWAEKLRRARYDFDEEALRPYFAAPKVLDGLFAIAERLYGVRIKPIDVPVWHPSVKSFAIHEESGELTAIFHVDIYPREEKRDGAWMHGLVTSPFGSGKVHVEVLTANVTLPLGDAPALLTHREVETLFHEFGHLMHHASSRVPVRSLGGTSVAWDFVELPSQIMENWCWEREALDLFARHVETGALVPDELLAKMRAARGFRAAAAMMRQLGFAEVDLALHVDWDPSRDASVVDYARAIFEAHAPTRLPPSYAMIASFGHLFGSSVGYAAGYYSYKWAEVLDADAFSRFKREGLFDRGAGRAFRDTILARGDSEDATKLWERFMGREPRLDALFERVGLVAAA